MANFIDIGTEAKEEKTFSVACFKFPTSTLFRPENVKRALLFRPQPRDVIICSYPKCDSKSIDVIVWKLLYPNCKLPPVNDVTNRYLPSMEMIDIQEHLIKRKSPRLFKTHLPFHLTPFYKRAKYIYIVRTPWEVCISYYKLLWLINNCTDSFDEFFTLFLEGKMGFGCYFNHVSSWNKRLNENNVLILCHEHVRNNPRSALFTIAAFLGDGYLKQLLYSHDLENEILKTVSWESFKRQKHFEKNSATKSFIKPKCTEEQIGEIIKKVSEKFPNTAIEHLWLNLLKKYDLLVSRNQMDQ